MTADEKEKRGSKGNTAALTVTAIIVTIWRTINGESQTKVPRLARTYRVPEQCVTHRKNATKYSSVRRVKNEGKNMNDQGEYIFTN